MTTLHRIETKFLGQARERPDALAVSSPYGPITYGQLDRATAAYASKLVDSDRAAAKTVAILADRGPRVVMAALACARANRPFVILDLAYPTARLQTLLEICRPGLLILAGRGAADAASNFDLPTLAIGPFADVRGEPEPLPLAPLSANQPAYLLFTSGSTGVPKCVVCSHRPLVNFVDWQARTFGLTSSDRFSMLSGLSHDPILRDIFTPLSLGASIHIPSQAALTAPGGLHAWFTKERPTVAHMTPQLGRLLTTGAKGAERLDDLRYVFWGGDILRYATVDALSDVAPACESVNFYGATETPQAVCFHRVKNRKQDGVVPVGVGVDGFEVEVRNDAGRPATMGEVGEVVVRSRFLTLGYVHDGVLPDALPRPASTYRTGDVGILGADGQLLVRGRRDDQVKIRGYRVEMAEVTTAALSFPQGVAQAVTLNIGSSEQPRLCCFVQPANADGGVDTDALRRYLETLLPSYMTPERSVVVAEMPLLANGKLDRQVLIRSQQDDRSAQATSALKPIETQLAAKWRDIFAGRDITAGSSFAALGGDSLSYVNASLSLEQVLGRVPDGWTTMTIGELAATARAGERRSPFAYVESAMVFRALAIALVVASHFQMIYSAGAATSALFWISGFLFGGLQLRESDRLQSVEPIARLLRGVALPLMAVTFPIVALKALTHHDPELSSLLLNVDLMDYTRANAGPNYLLWYVHCVIHMLLVIGGLLLVFRSVLRVRRPAVVAIASALALGLFGRFVLPDFYLPDFWRRPVEGLSFFGHSPTAHLATFALAALTGLLKGRWRWSILGLTFGYAALSGPSYGWIDSLAIAVTATSLVLVPRLRAPQVLQLPVYAVAGASLFIYLLHFRFLQLLHGMLGLPVVVAFLCAIAGGVGAWAAWNFAARRLNAATRVPPTMVRGIVSKIARLGGSPAGATP